VCAISGTDDGAVVVRVDVGLIDGLTDPRTAPVLEVLNEGQGLVSSSTSVSPTVSLHDIWWFKFPASVGDEARADAVEVLTARLLVDAGRVLTTPWESDNPTQGVAIEVALLPGVTDPEVAAMLGVLATILPVDRRPIAAARGHHIRVFGSTPLEPSVLARLANPAIEHLVINTPLSPWVLDAPAMTGVTEMIPIRACDDSGLAALSAERRLSLDLQEMRAIRTYFAGTGRDPTDVELETLAQTWSEHCKHKTFRALIDYSEADAAGHVSRRMIDGLLPTCFVAVTAELNRPYVRSAFADNAGVVAFDDDFDLAIKVETHNRPSAIEPFGGANTGLGGVLRDIVGVSARPFAGLDVLFFGPSDYPMDRLPSGVLHPARVRDGVVRGIGDYGNKMGIPTVAGGVRFDPAYVTNPLVFAGALGIVPRGAHPTRPRAGDLIVVAGGATGRDGLRGATFSSVSMDATTGVVSGGAVQIGDPIMEKRLLDFQLEARDARLYTAVTDCGAGGLSSAVGELADNLGADVELADVPSKYAGLAPWELWLSEAQERMVLAVPPGNLSELQRLATRWGCPVSVIGTFTQTGHLRVLWRGEVVADLALEFLHRGLPRQTLTALWEPPLLTQTPDAGAGRPASLWAPVVAHLRSPNGRLAREIIATYDTEVQGGTLARPVVGPSRLGAGDGVVVMPFEVQHLESAPSAVLGVGFCPERTRQDPRLMAWHAIDEAIRNVVAVGADPDRLCLLDNFAWGDTHDPHELGALVRTAEACADAARYYRAPFISGKDSLHNAWTMADGTRRSIPGTLVITALGVLPAGQNTCTTDFKEAGDLIAHVGHLCDAADGLPAADTLNLYRAVFQAHRAGLLSACHDVSSGGILATIAEMALGGMLGADLDLDPPPAKPNDRAGSRLQDEGLGRFIVTFSESHRAAVEAAFVDLPLHTLGRVTATPWLRATLAGQTESTVLDALLTID